MKKLIAVSLFVSIMGLAAQASAASYGPINNVGFRNEARMDNPKVSYAKPGYGDSASCMGSTMSQKLEEPGSLSRDEKLNLAQTNYGRFVLNSSEHEDHSGKP